MAFMVSAGFVEPGSTDWGVDEAGMKQMDDDIGVMLKNLGDMGQLDNAIVVFTYVYRKPNRRKLFQPRE
jgi:hypothetical protein